MREQGPGSSPWRKGEPEAHGLSSETLNRAADALALTGERQGLVVIRNGVLVYERYWRNDYHLASPEWRNVSFSSGKSWGSTMVGLAYTKGLLGLDDLAAVYHRPEISGLRPETTIRHLLTMTSGGTLNVKPSSRPPRRLDDARSPGPGVEYAWEKVGEKGSPSGYGVSLPAGQTFYYDGAAADHLADIVAAAAGVSSHRFMMEQIISPLGCEQFNYQPEGVDRNDNVRFGGSIVLSCRDMARLGQLYLNGGRWDGRQLIDADYISQATSSSPANPSYGFLWWLNAAARVPAAPVSMFFAAGARGQFCFVLPDQEMVIATMGFGAAQLSAEAAWDALGPVISHLPPSSP